MSKIRLSETFIKDRVKLALAEDLYPDGDITTNLLNKNEIITAKLISNQKAIVAGLLFTKHTFNQVDKKIKFILKKRDGSSVKKNSVIAIIKGKASSILVAERVALNFLSHISGIATKTNQFVKLAGKKCKICCTRKTIPNYRVIQKYAVRLGGGTNHRFNLSDEFLIKDNHLASAKKFEEIVKKAIKAKKGTPIYFSDWDLTYKPDEHLVNCESLGGTNAYGLKCSKGIEHCKGRAEKAKEAEIGRIFIQEGLKTASKYIEEEILPLFLKQEKKRIRQAGGKR